MDDSQLIQEYASSRSEEAFRGLVDQYVGLVYSACFRRLRDRHLAEDATQAVFLLLSQKAASLRRTHLIGWLLTTARYACANMRKSELRRQRREQVAAMTQETTKPNAEDDLAGLLDEGLCRLKGADREALVLRYLKEQPVSEVARKLGVSEAAARKRIDRGVEKLRRYFSRRGITTSSAAIGAVLSEQLPGAFWAPGARHAVMQGVLQVCSAGSRGTAASVAIAKGTKTMMFIAKLKTAAALAVVAAAVGTTGWAMTRALAENVPVPRGAAASAPAGGAAIAAAEASTPATEPALDLSTPEKTFGSIIEALKAGDREKLYRCLTVDPTRQPSLIDRVLDWDLAINRMLAAGRRAYGAKASALAQEHTIDAVMEMMAAIGPREERVTGDTAELSAEVPRAIAAVLPARGLQVVALWSGAPIWFKRRGDEWKMDIDQSMRVEMSTTPPAVNSDQAARRAATMLQEMADSTDLIAVGISTGELATAADAGKALDQARTKMLNDNGITGYGWMVLPAKAVMPATDDNPWTLYSATPSLYAAVMDPDVLRDGHPTLRLGSDAAVKGNTAHYQRVEHSASQYVGRRVRVTAWIKCAGVVNDAGVRIRVVDADENVLTDDGQRQDRPVKGTRDWKMYGAFADVPEGAVKIQWGFILNGKGNIWVDLDSAKLELAGDGGK